MPGHLQKLVKQGFMTAAELVTCRVPEDLAFLAPAEGYMVSFMAFYEQGFDKPSHQFLHSLLRYYSLKLHHLTPSEVLYIAAFMICVRLTWGLTLCLICGITSFAPDYDRPRARKWWPWAMWTSLSNLNLELIPAFTSRCPTLRPGGGKYDSF
jgi:hypothetical protein